MSELSKLIYYFLLNYPYPEEMSKARLTKSIYLIDWKYVIEFGRTVSGIKWFFDRYGPYVDDVMEEVKKNEHLFQIKSDSNYYGTPKTIIATKDDVEFENDMSLDAHLENVLKQIIGMTKSMNYTEFLSVVYDTYPVKYGTKYHSLDLVENANRFRQDRQLQIK